MLMAVVRASCAICINERLGWFTVFRARAARPVLLLVPSSHGRLKLRIYRFADQVRCDLANHIADRSVDHDLKTRSPVQHPHR